MWDLILIFYIQKNLIHYESHIWCSRSMLKNKNKNKNTNICLWNICLKVSSSISLFSKRRKFPSHVLLIWSLRFAESKVGTDVMFIFIPNFLRMFDCTKILTSVEQFMLAYVQSILYIYTLDFAMIMLRQP